MSSRRKFSNESSEEKNMRAMQAALGISREELIQMAHDIISGDEHLPWHHIQFFEVEWPKDMQEMTGHRECWLNCCYQVLITRDIYQNLTEKNDDARPPEDFPKMTWLSIKRRDKRPIHDWRELQGIKNELLGPHIEAVELYPSNERIVDTSNQYHLWCLEEGAVFPFGWNLRKVSMDAEQARRVGAVQRDPAKDHDQEVTTDYESTAEKTKLFHHLLLQIAEDVYRGRISISGFNPHD